MNERYYFTCPIKAAYMNHEFGVITYIELSNKSRIYDKYFIKDWNHRELELDAKDKYHCNKYYVAPESEHIFEPKKGDLGIERNLHTLEPCFFGGTYWFYDNDYLEIKPHPQKVDIIYRNGKNFFNPKEEN